MRNLLLCWAGAGVLLALFAAAPAAAVATPQWTWDGGEAHEIQCLTMNRQGSRIAVGTMLRQNGRAVIALFDWRSPVPINEWELPNTIVAVALNEAGTRVAAVSGDTVHVFDADQGPLFTWTDFRGSLTTVDFNDNGSLLAVNRRCDEAMSEGGAVHLIDADEGELLWTSVLSEHVPEPPAPRISYALLDDAGERILVVYEGGQLPGDNYAAFYDIYGETPDAPLWFTMPMECWWSDGCFAGDGQHFMLASGVRAHYFDTLPAVPGEKAPLWTHHGGGFGTFINRVAMSGDGSLAAHFGPYNYWMGEHEYGCVEVFAADGELLWSEDTVFQGPTGHVAADGSRVVFSADMLGAEFDRMIYVYDRSANSIIWSASGYMGMVQLSGDGAAVVSAGGRMQQTLETEPLCLFHLEDNEQAACAFTYPTAGTVVAGMVNVAGTSADADDEVIAVEILGPHGITRAQPDGATFAEWTAEVNCYDPVGGPFTLKARSVDARFKHGPWAEVDIQIAPLTPTPGPTSTPPPTRTPTLTPTPSPVVSPTPVPEPTATATPAPEFTPSATPGPDALDLRLLLNSDWFAAGDTFQLLAEARNPGPAIMAAPLFVILEAHGAFFFWPSWRQMTADGGGIDYALRDVPAGATSYEIIPPFIWPSGTGAAYGLLFYGALVQPDLTALLTPVRFIAWGYAS